MKKDEMTRDEMYRLLPELCLIENAKLRETCADVWIEALEAGGWFEKAGWGKFPFSVTLRDDCPENLLTHTGQVALTSLAIYDSLAPVRGRVGECSRDTVLAGALLHDVGKLLEYDLDAEGRSCNSRTAKKFRHPVWSYYFAQKHGMHEDIVHLVLTHSRFFSPEGANAYRTAESIIVKASDGLCYEYVDKFYAYAEED
jgi:putative nucleotidyltransferase with HDIG domain